MVEAARIIAASTGSFWTDQLNNKDQLATYHEMAEEIWIQADGQIDGFVQSVGTAASLRGIGEALRRHHEQVEIVAVEPAESPVLSGGQSGAHKIDGIGAGFVVPLWQADLAGRIERVSTEEAAAMSNRLARHDRHRHVRHRNEVSQQVIGRRHRMAACDGVRVSTSGPFAPSSTVLERKKSPRPVPMSQEST